MTIRFLFLFLILSFSAQAQLSFDPVQFPTDLEAYISKAGNASATEAVGDFTGFYTANRLTNAQKIQVIKISNALVNQHIAITAFDHYLRAMNGMLASNQGAKLDRWNKAAALSLNRSKDDFVAFVEISKNVFQDQVVTRQGAMLWVTDNAEVEMDLREANPAFFFSNMNLYCYTPGDTVIIRKTKGKYYAATNEWRGEGGEYWWTRVGLDSAEIFAELKGYTINFNNGNIKADTALLHYPLLFKETIPGRLFDKPQAQSMGSRSMYPQFESHKKDFSNISFGKGKLTGAFGLKGRILVGKGSDSAKAELLFTYKNKPTFRMLADEFMVRENKVGTKKAAMILYLDKDSIYHPQVEFTYRLTDHFIHIYRNNEGISSAPFYDTYHNIEFYVDEVKWDMINPKVDLDMVNDNEPAKFESVNYFRDVRYEREQNVLNYNPLQRIKLYCDKRNVTGFYIQDYAPNYKSNISEIRSQMIGLHDKGYVTLDEKTDYVTVRRKLYDYVNAHFGKTDYDAIAFFSIIKRYPNASVSLINNDIQVQGVPKFQFSDSQNVYVVPKDQILTIKKNRNMDLAGKVRAGKVDFFGTGFAFDYTTFQIRLNNVDSMKFFMVDEKTGSDIPIRSAIQNVYGTLAIDHPGNKSGRRRYPGYPIFKSDVGSKIYYDKPSTQLGVYDRNRFYFDVDPFTIDSLSNLNFATISLGGKLISGGIMPDLRHEVYVQPDRSLGFVLKPNQEGYPLYGNKGRAFVELSLSDEGFFGKGDLRYLASLSSSERFIFLLDSMNAQCSAFTNERTEIYPDAGGVNVFEHWMPYHDTLYVYSQAEKIGISKDRVKLNGTIYLTPARMAAGGVSHIREAEIVSNSFWMQPDRVLADTSNFRMRDYRDSVKYAFYSGSVNANVDLNAAKGLFVYNQEGVNTRFDYNLYEGAFKQFTWNMDDRTLDFDSRVEGGKDVSYLRSTRASQDSLQFISGRATLDLKDFTIYAGKVPYIGVGDAWIYPDSGKVVIRADANMDELVNARIIADSLQKFHTIEKVRTTILGRFNLIGDGKYQYMDKHKQVQEFFLEEIKIDDKHRLYGKTNIPDSANFSVGSHIEFRGNAFLRSTQKNLEYAGFFLAKHNLPYPKTDWFRGSAVINPDSVFLVVDTIQYNPLRQTMMTGINISNDSTHVYPLFFSRKRNGSDPELMRIGGTLVYNEPLGIFRYGDRNKIYGQAKRGAYLEFSEGKKNAYYEGRFKFGYDAGTFAMNAAGNATYGFSDSSFRMKLSLLFNFPFPDAATRIMFDSINDQSSGSPAMEFDENFLSRSLSEFIPEGKEWNKVLDDLGDKSIPDVEALRKFLFISSINLKWNQATRSFVSEGDINLNSMDKFRIERKLSGRLELTRKRSGDDLTLYLQSPGGSWYYFKYQRGTLYTISSDVMYNQYIRDQGDKISKKQEDFSLRLASIGDRNKFVRIMKASK